MSRPGVITQVRMTSTRLPGKVLIEVAGKSLLEHHLDRLAQAGLDVYIATTTNQTDDPVISLAERRGLPFHRGSEHDVLSRFTGCIREHGLETVVRVSSDCPLIDGVPIAQGLEAFAAADDPWLYVSNSLERTFPRGFDFEIFSAEALVHADEHAHETYQREHVTPYLYANPEGRMTLLNIAREQDRSSYRITLDTPDDLVLIRTLIEQYDAASLDTDEIVALLDAHPELVAINAHVEQKSLGQ